MFSLLSKIHFESKSQRTLVSSPKTPSCFLFCQRYILKANHNYKLDKGLVAVLFSLLSKIHFESKSQRVKFYLPQMNRCFLFCQRYILKANHNNDLIVDSQIQVVFSFVKDTFWKQITTVLCCFICQLELFSLLSKIHFESKSQRSFGLSKYCYSCFLFCQRYILKANHNQRMQERWTSMVVFSFVKDTFWKQITTTISTLQNYPLLFSLLSKIHFESKSQQWLFAHLHLSGCFLFCQRYILKANHNSFMVLFVLKFVVFSFVKDTFWKQITTQAKGAKHGKGLFSLLSKIHFESKSQRGKTPYSPQLSCFLFCQRYILKANHNKQRNRIDCRGVVFSFVKDTFWKQITTIAASDEKR